MGDDPAGREQLRIGLGHGSGGRLSRELVRQVLLPALGPGEEQAPLEDAAIISFDGRGRLAFTTDTFVVDPLEFPGGDLGVLAINGTINDLAMRGARPIALSVALVIEEGLAMADLQRLARSMGRAAEAAGVSVVTGDTKVVPRGQVDKVFATTSGVGVVPEGVEIGAGGLQPGDRLLLSGPIGEHGVAVMSRRAGLSFSTEVTSDTAPLATLVAALLDAVGPAVHALRDPTRGGLAAALTELTEDSGVAALLAEEDIPVREPVRAACDLLGLDPLDVACEGRLVAAIAPERAEEALCALRAHPLGRQATLIGRVETGRAGEVLLRTAVGGLRVVEPPAGELLPRIC